MLLANYYQNFIKVEKKAAVVFLMLFSGKKGKQMKILLSLYFLNSEHVAFNKFVQFYDQN